MAKTLQFRRGTTSELSTQTGAVGELFVDTTKDTVVVMDGSTTGGFPLQRELLSGTNIKTVNGQSVLGSGDITISGGSSFSGSYDDLTNKPTFKTINGQSVLGSGNLTISGSGTAFDQDLNTTDDVVFNSALVGDVSIVGNSIGAIDSYGNADTLVISSNLNVQVNGQSTVTQTISASALNRGFPAYFELNGLSTTFMFSGYGYLNGTENLSSFGPGTQVTMQTGYGDMVVALTSAMMWNGMNWVATCTLVSGVNTYQNPNSAFYVNVTSNVVALVNALEVTETGVDVQGQFTVNNVVLNPNNIQGTLYSGSNIKTINGQSILGSGNLTIAGGSGSAFDQDLNTIDDVVFNSALVGDVSIVGNTISAIDSYGNADALVVDGEFNVTINTATTAIVSYSAPNITSASAYYDGYNFEFFTTMSQADRTKLGKIKPNTRVNFTGADTQNFGFANGGYFIATSVTVLPSGQVNISGNGAFVGYNIGNMGGQPQNVSIYGMTWSQSETVGVNTTPLSVTETGVAVTGALTLNGQPITAGSASSFDQDLNTTDDVVFNSALVGDVSIIGNTIGAVDSYGNAEPLIVNNGLTLSAGTVQTQQTVTKTITPGPISGPAGGIVVSTDGGFSLEEVQLVSAIPPGTIINMTNIYVPSQGWVASTGSMEVWQVSNITSNSCTIYPNTFNVNGYGNYQGSYLGSGITSNTWSWSQTGIVNIPATPLIADASGVVITGTLEVNGQQITPSISYDQDLNTTDDVVFNSALVGDVSIIGDTVSAINSYGLADTLTVSGGLNVQFGELSAINQTISASVQANGGPAAFILNYGGDTFSFDGFGYFNGTENVSPFIAGSQITINDPYGTVILTLTSGMTWDGMRWNASCTVISRPFAMTLYAYSINLSRTTDTRVNALEVTETGVTVNGDLTLADNAIAPSNSTAIVKWAKINVGGQVYFTPLYQ